MKARGVSFYDPEVQRELGRRPKKTRQPYARNVYILAALLKGFDLEFVQTGEVLSVNAGEFSSIVSVVDYLMAQPQMADQRQKWIKCVRKEKFYGVTGLTRTLTGNIDQRTGKRVLTFMGWRVLGLRKVD